MSDKNDSYCSEAGCRCFVLKLYVELEMKILGIESESGSWMSDENEVKP